jgi:methyl-accepting chemotaxis protein
MRTVEKGSDSIRNSGQTLQNLSESVNTVTDYVTRIVASSEEQSIGVEQVHSAVLQMDQITQANVAQASKLTSVATSLSDQSTRLHDMLSRFRLQA